MFKFVDKILAKQLSHPQGLLGYFVLRKLNRMNASIVKQAIEELDIQKNNKVLDIGFGGGLSFDIIKQKELGTKLFGLEISEKAIKHVKKDFREHIVSGVLTLEQGSVEKIPFKKDAFDKIFSVNTVYFWDDLKASFKEIRRILKPGGSFVLALREKDILKKFPPTAYGFHYYDTKEIIKAMETAGFSTSIAKHEDVYPFICVKAV